MNFSQRLKALKQQVMDIALPLEEPFPACTFIFSVSDGPKRAEVFHVSDISVDMAWRRGVLSLGKRMELRKLQGKYLRVDWVTGAIERNWNSFEQFLQQYKRSYCRFGFALDPKFSVLFTEQECNANAIYYGGNKIPHAVFNRNNFTVYQKRRFPRATFSPSGNTPVWTIATAGFFCDETGQTFFIPPPGEMEGPLAGLSTGHRAIPELTPEIIDHVIGEGAHWLARQVTPTGKYIYGYFPCFDRQISTYNSLRHASSTYSLLEALEYTQDQTLEKPAKRAVQYLVDHLIQQYEPTPGRRMAFVIDDVSHEIKLGGNGVALLALVKWTELTGSQQFLPLMDLLAEGIAWMQNSETGEFVHVLHSADLTLKNRYRTIYYDGEAVFGLLRLYGLTKHARWLEVARQSFDSFLDGRHAEVHDHWLSYSVNEITRYIPDQRYFQFGINNISGYLDFILTRETTFPTLLELSMATQTMLDRLESLPEYRATLETIDLDKFVQARDHRAKYLLNGFFWPEMAMFYKNPERIMGAFFIRHHAFRTRIDDSEHYLSGLIAYATMLKKGLAGREKTPFLWDPVTVREATGGVWVKQPPSDWRGTGVCAYHESFAPGHMLIARGKESPRGLSPHHVEAFAPRASAIITTEPARWEQSGLPLLQISDVSKSVIAMARTARDCFGGKVLSITGTSGKTSTVAMARQILSKFGRTGSSLASANMLYGIAWNMAAMPNDAAWWVVEQSLARMDETAQLVRPDVAVVLNVSEGHLEYWTNTENIALQKSKIFSGMAPGSCASVNRDMEHFPIFASASSSRGVRFITFGRHEEADLKLLDIIDGSMVFSYQGKDYTAALPLTAEYMAMNCLALLGAFLALGLPLEQFLDKFRTVKPQKGRGELHQLRIDNKHIHLTDESYNANPASMRAALSAYGTRTNKPESRIVILGDMLELAENSQQLHENIFNTLEGVNPDRILLCGPNMRYLWDKAKGQYQGKWYENLDELRKEVVRWLRDGDYLFVKGSHGSDLWQLVDELKRMHSS